MPSSETTTENSENSAEALKARPNQNPLAPTVNLGEDQEKWIPAQIQGCPFYEVSNLGRVRSVDRVSIRISKNGVKYPHRNFGKIMKLSLSRGYPILVFRMNGKSNTLYVHRILATAFLPNPERKPQVNHKDGTRNNNNISNLEWVTASENAYHSFNVLGNRSKLPRGEDHFESKLSESDVLIIRSQFPALSGPKLAERFGVDNTTIYQIIRRNTWTHI